METRLISAREVIEAGLGAWREWTGGRFHAVEPGVQAAGKLFEGPFPGHGDLIQFMASDRVFSRETAAAARLASVHASG